MPLPLLAIPAGQILLEGAVIAGGFVLRALASNAVRTVAVRGTAAAVGAATGNAVLNEAQSPATPATNTTTVVGTGKLNCGEFGNYGDMLKKSGDNKFDRDHVPSKAALKKAAEKILEDTGLIESITQSQMDALFGKGSSPGLIAEQGKAVAIPKRDHQQHSETYGNRNADKIDGDSDNLQKAAERDTKAIEDAEGKEMDPECLEKYKKAAEQIRKKTHAEYIKELKELIKQTMKNVK